jgi:site-specific DNA-methyltransferase (cytosine-N4-specific)
MPPTSQIPVGSQFSPTLIDLPALTAVLVSHSGDREALIEAVNNAPVRLGDRTPETRRNRSLPLEAAVQYGLLAPTSWTVTDFGRSLSELPHDEQFRAFARHILLNLGGLRVVQGTEEMIAEGAKITGDTLARHLTSQGFFVAEHNTAINTLRMWLARAGVFPLSGKGGAAWTPDRRAIESLIGLDKEGMEALAAFRDEQKAFCQSARITGQ